MPLAAIQVEPETAPSLTEVAVGALLSGLCILPADPGTKRPTIGAWSEYQRRLPNDEEFGAWRWDSGLCIICGAVSGNVEMLDFDEKAVAFPEWRKRVEEEAPGLLARCYIETTPRGGKHVLYRCETAIPGNQKFATQPGPDGKPRVTIESRGEGGLVLVAPSPGYVQEQGDLTSLPVLTGRERNALIGCAKVLDPEHPEPTRQHPEPAGGGGRPGDDYCTRADADTVLPLLKRAGWRFYGSARETKLLTRPGKKSGVSASLFPSGVLHVFTSNAPPFEPDTAYSPFAVYTLLEHGGDFKAAARALAKQGYGNHQKPAPGGQTRAASEDAAGAKGVDLETTAPYILTPKELFAFDTTDDPSTLLGRRWLCKGGSCLVLGQTGLGKSSFSVQAAMTWALNRPLFGITPTRPLKSLFINGENDVGDLHEMVSGVVRGAGFQEALDELDSRISFVTEAGVVGEAFLRWVRLLVLKYQPDLCWIDPLFSYLGGNVSDQETVSAFLRNGLGAIAQETGCTWMIVHHCNKPVKDPTLRNSWQGGDYAYLGSGSAELANWARAVLSLRENEDDCYELRASKRGTRAGLVDKTGRPATEVYIKHGSSGIFWERATAPEVTEALVEQRRIEDVLEAMEVKDYTRTDLAKLTMDALGCRKGSLSTPGRWQTRVFNAVLKLTTHPQRPGIHRKSSKGNTL